METLKEILKKFDKERTRRVNAGTWNEDAVAECFYPCAEDILCNGCFLINGKYIIDLGAIELYYHEEKGDIKDYLMYHINDNKKIKSKIRNNDGELPYFKFGNLNLHQSGVDVTFENEEKKYRASFLIRSYRVLKTEDGLYPENDNTKYDPHSTHIFDDMFYGGYGNTEIVWIPNDRKGGIVKQYPRKNVAMYKDAETKLKASESDYKLEKEKSKENKSYYPKCFKYGSNYYMQCMRNWRFQLENIEEEK